MKWIAAFACFSLLVACSHSPRATASKDALQTVLQLAPSAENPRNSEGDFIRLKNGDLLFVYTHFTAGADDEATAHLAQSMSHDQGKTWTQNDLVVVAREGAMNVMSVSLERITPDTIGLFYLRKNSWQDCRPLLRLSGDEGQTWGKALEVFPQEDSSYYVMNNDRVVRMLDGRLLLPLALHYTAGWPQWTGQAQILCAYSDDNGRTWTKGQVAPVGGSSESKQVTLQEPGVVELKDHRLLLFCRTDAGSQYIGYSRDRGETWSALQPSNMISPMSPASIERIPQTGDLLLVWNNHERIDPTLKGKRTPFTAAVSHDEGQTWTNIRTIHDDPFGWYCYTAVEFVGNHVLLAYCAGDRRENNGLALTRISRIPVDFFYPPAVR